MNFAVLMACHNRRCVTLSCLSGLLPQMGEEDAVFLVDDGSDDGTADAVVALCDKRVTLIKGNGRLFWAKGMRKAWETAIDWRDDWEGFLWLNDDTELNADAICRLLKANDGESIVIGDLENAKGEIVYGLRAGGLFTGNCVLIPRKVYERLGMICGDYSHAWADSDYAMMAKHAGIQVVCAGVIGKAEGHPNRPSLRNLSLRERIGLLRDPKGWNLRDLWLYRRRNWSICTAVLSCMHMIVHVVLGDILKANRCVIRNEE